MVEYLSRSTKETQKIGEKFARSLAPVSALQIGLIGDLGAGKTTFVQGMARGLGIDPRHYVNSPTFTLINEYGDRLVHIDLYRIEKPTEVETLGIEDCSRPGRVIVIEWPEKAPTLKGQLDFLIHFEWISEKERRIWIEKRPA